MKIRTVFTSIVLPMILAILIIGCECVATHPNCNGNFYFVLLDKSTGRDLIQGTDVKYKLDSITAHAGSDSTVYPIHIIPVTENRLGCELNGSSDTLYLKLNDSDTDTLLLSFRNERRTKCCAAGSRIVTDIKYNGKATASENGAFILKK